MLAKLAGDGFVAGGYARDVYLGRVNPKDIDLYIHVANTQWNDIEYLRGFSEVVLARFGQTLDPEVPNHQEYPDSEFKVFKSTGPSDRWEAVDVIFYRSNFRSIMAVLSSFDLYICQAFLSPSGTIEHSHNFLEVVHGGFVERYRSITTKENALNHIIRIKAKYPEYRVLFNLAFSGQRTHWEYIAPRLYQQEFLSGDTGEIFQTEVQSPTGNGVRLGAGAGDTQAVFDEYSAFIPPRTGSRVYDHSYLQAGLSAATTSRWLTTGTA